MVQATTTRFIPADFLTSSHYVFGQVKATKGLYGVLGDPTTDIMEVYDASIARVQTPDNVINYSPMMWVVKRQIVAVCLSKREYIGSITLARGGYTTMYEYPIQITTTVYELQGTAEWPGRFEFKALMAEGTNPFIVLLNATLVSTLFPKLRIERPAMLFNRAFLDTLIMTKKVGQEVERIS
jgi:hypothetical protein